MRPSAWTAAWDWIEALDPVTVFDRLTAPSWTGNHAEGADILFRFLLIYAPITLLLPVEMVLRFRKIALRA
jgi:hypothetical protein